MSDKVVLSVPAKAEYARTVRITSAALAMRAGMTYDEVEDVRLAAEEAFIFVADRAGPDTPVDLTFVLDDGGVELSVGPVPAAGGTDDEVKERAEYARFILEAVCDELEIGDGETCSVSLVKRIASGAAGD